MQHFRHGGCRVDDARHRQVNAGRHGTDRTDHPDFAIAEPAVDKLTLDRIGEGIDIGRGDACAFERCRQLTCVGAVDAEAQRRPILAALQPVLDDVTHQLCFAHQLLQLALDVIAAPDLDARQVRHVGRIGRELRQQPLVDQVADGHGNHQILPHKPHALAPGRCRQPDEPDVPTLGNQPVDHVSADVALVHDHQRSVRDFTAGQRLHRCDLNLCQTISAGMVRLHHTDVADALRLERGHGLVDQRDSRGREDHAVALGLGALDDLGCGDGLPRASGHGTDDGLIFLFQ